MRTIVSATNHFDFVLQEGKQETKVRALHFLMNNEVMFRISIRENPEVLYRWDTAQKKLMPVNGNNVLSEHVLSEIAQRLQQVALIPLEAEL